MKTTVKKKTLWTKPQLKTVTAEELKKIVVVSACSTYEDQYCIRGFRR